MFQESQNRCIESENERQRIQTDFETCYQQMQHLEDLQLQQQQQKSAASNSLDAIDQVCLKFIAILRSFYRCRTV